MAKITEDQATVVRTSRGLSIVGSRITLQEKIWTKLQAAKAGLDLEG